jgi:hypothetical protein
MKLNHVPPSTGLVWVRQGVKTFFRQPLAMAGLFFIFMMAVSVLSLVPFLGAALALALLPAATLGLMAATREAEKGQFPMPFVLASAFRAGRERARAMLTLGLMYAAGSLVVMGLSTLFSGQPAAELMAPSAEGGELPAEALMRDPAVVRGLIINMVLYFPLGLLFWHAPALVHWHGVSPPKACSSVSWLAGTTRAPCCITSLAGPGCSSWPPWAWCCWARCWVGLRPSAL